jgi:hypothetical protein
MHVSKKMFAEFEAYWRRLQDAVTTAHPIGTHIPTRKQFNPMHIPKMLPYLFMIERLSDDQLIVRLTGTALDEAFEMIATGQNILDLFGADQRDFFTSLHDNLSKQPCGAVVRRSVTTANGKGYELTSKSLPLASDDGEVKYVVGMLGADISHLPAVEVKNLMVTSSVTDFFYLDLGFGVPNDAPMVGAKPGKTVKPFGSAWAASAGVTHL